METNSYRRIKKHVFSNLTKNAGLLAADQIKKEIENAQQLIGDLGLPTFARILPDKSELEELSAQDWARMRLELETHFSVEMKNGILIQGEEQQLRDQTWWSGKVKITNKNYYWNRYENYIKGFLPPEVAATIDKDTDLVMNNIGNPALDQFEHKGMVVGHVQSGKTGNYAALVCKAADAGYKFIVVIAGDKNNLRNQTQKRLNESFVGVDKGVQVGAGIGNSEKEFMPICLTTTERDFKKQDADRNSQSLNFDNVKAPILIVIKKNSTSLTSVYKWLKNQYKNKIADYSMLIIDDESGYASINTREADSPTTINKGIRNLITLFSKGSYVAYTATPYANIFIDHEASSADLGEDLFPKDFIFALDAPTNYLGARRIFLDADQRFLVEIPEEDLRLLPFSHNKEFRPGVLPQSLCEAVRLFIINIAIRKLRGQEREHNSMLVHVSRFTAVHQKIALAIKTYLGDLKKDVGAYAMLSDAEDHSSIIQDLKNTFEQRLNDLPREENWRTVLNSICQIINKITIQEVHQSALPFEYRDDIAANAIVVGGASLSRGYTLEGLSVSYFIRSTVFYDTLMQMGRWFGYRTGYEGLCRVYLPEQTADYFSGIIEATEDLIKSLKEMADENRTPYDFGLAVKQHPDSALQITARNKQKNAHDFTVSMRLDGHLKETAYFSFSEKERKENLKTVKNLVETLEQNYPAAEKVGKVAGTRLWRGVDKNAVKDFLEQFKIYKTDPFGFSGRMPIGFIKEYAEKRETEWDVALYSGSGTEQTIGSIVIKKEERIFDQKTEKNGTAKFYEVRKRQVSSGSAEAIPLTEQERKDIGEDRDKIRKALPRPLLMLHVLEAFTQENKDSAKKELNDYAAFGISFPDHGRNSNEDEVVTLKINSVKYKDLLEQLDENINEE